MRNQSSTAAREAARSAWLSVGAPILGLVLVTIALALAAFAGFARQQDRNYSESTSRLVASAIDGRALSLGNVALDYANWDNAYESVTLRWNPQWVENSFYSSVADGIFVFRSGMGVRYSWYADDAAPVADATTQAALSAAFHVPNINQLKRAAQPAGTVARTLTRVGNHLVVVAVAPITREDDAARIAQAGPQDFVAMVDVITPDELAAMGVSLDLSSLTFVPSLTPQGDDVANVLYAADGAMVGAMEWKHTHPGASAFTGQILPVIVALMVIGVLAFLIARIMVMRQVGAMARAQAALESNQSKSEFLTRVSHELRTPLNAIIGYAEIIEEETEAPETKRDATSIVAAARHLSSLLNDIIDQSRIDAGRVKINAEVLPVAGMTAEVQGLMRPAAVAAKVKFTASSDPTANFVIADHVRLRQCLLNLIGNAIKFAPNGEVTMRATLDNMGPTAMVVFAVTDTGIGIAKNELEHIFRPFGQANPGIGKAFGGTGLGLSISRDLARAMGGDISVESELGKGSTFSLRIPAATAQLLKAA